jgi:hypothetical protein
MQRTNSPRRTASEPWWAHETQIDLASVPQHVPPHADGSRVSIETLRRWARVGVYGLRLRVFAASARGTATTIQEVQRFLAALSGIRGLD